MALHHKPWLFLRVTNPAGTDDEGVREYKTFAQKYMPRLNLDDATAIPGCDDAAAIEHVLKLCGDNLTRENLLKQATNLKDYAPPLVLKDVKICNSQDNITPSTTCNLRNSTANNGSAWAK